MFRISEMSLSLPPKKDVHNMWKHMSLNAECHHFCEFSSPKKQPERATTILNDRPERFLTPSYETISYPGFPASSGCGDGAIFGRRSGVFGGRNNWKNRGNTTPPCGSNLSLRIWVRHPNPQQKTRQKSHHWATPALRLTKTHRFHDETQEFGVILYTTCFNQVPIGSMRLVYLYNTY